jgi:hypothetical protein
LPAAKKDYLGTFSGLVRAAFLGETYRLGSNNYVLKPTLVGKYDVLRSIASPASEFERLVRDLPSDFKSVARSELYRKSAGWMEKGEESRRFKEIELGGKPFIVPILGKRNVGVDTSGDSEWTYLCIACFDDAECGYVYLERHLRLPKAKQPAELKWMKLNANYRKTVVENLPTLFEMSVTSILVIKTNALVRPEEKLTDAFVKLIEGSFSGYERLQGDLRARLRDGFFSLTNETPIHCDADFSPMSTDKVVRQLVKTLAKSRPFTPLHVGLKSEESHPIQVADVMCGAAKTLIREKRQSRAELIQIPFDNKLKGKGKDAKVYYWTNQRTTQVPRAVDD